MGWQLYQPSGRCYRYVDFTDTFTNQQARCPTLGSGAALASIRDADDLAATLPRLCAGAGNGGENFFIGAQVTSGNPAVNSGAGRPAGSLAARQHSGWQFVSGLSNMYFTSTAVASPCYW